MIGFIALGVVMLIWVLCWDSEDARELGQAQPGPEQHV